MDFSTMKSAADAFCETNDCAVKAVALATGEDYGATRWLFTEFGRRPRHGTPVHITKKVMDYLGYDMVECRDWFDARTIRSLEPEITSTGSYLVRTSRHILCVKNGVVEDWTRGRLHRIINVWRVKKKEA